jgi:hypothetical protein
MEGSTLLQSQSLARVSSSISAGVSPIVLLQYSEGKPQLWLELIVSEAEAERLPLPLPGGAAPITTSPRR